MRRFVVVSGVDPRSFAEPMDRCLASWSRAMAPSIGLHLWVDGELPDGTVLPRFVIRRMGEIGGWTEFVASVRGDLASAPRGDDGRPDPRWNPVAGAARFFVLREAVRTVPAVRIVWLDADVLAHRPVEESFLAAACPAAVPVSYVWRPDGSDLGFLSVDPRHPVAVDLIDRCVDVYVSGRFRQLPEWRSCDVFDGERREIEGDGDRVRFFDVGRGVGRRARHAFVNSILGSRFDHMKGSRKKAGGTPTSDLVVDRYERYWRERREVPVSVRRNGENGP